MKHPHAVPEAGQQRPGLRLPTMLRALRHRNYRLFFMGQLISLTGTWMQSVAQGWLVYRLTDSQLLLGVVSAAASLPVLIFSLSGGALADQVPKQRVLLVTQSMAMLLALTMAVLIFTGIVQVWHILLLALLLGLVNAFDAPARQAFAIEMVGRDDLLNAIALNSSMFNMARTVGPAVAGLIIARAGEAPVFLLNGLSYVAVIAGLLLMRLPRFEPPAARRRVEQLREGLSYIAHERMVRTLLLLAGTVSLFGLAYFPLLPALARDVLHTDARGLGLLAGASGIGALTAALILAQFSDHLPRGQMLVSAMLVFPIFLIGLTTTHLLITAMAMMLLIGWSTVTSLALTNTLVQSLVPDNLRARVMSVFTMLLLGLGPLGALAAGGVAQMVGNVALVIAGCAVVCWVLVLRLVLRVPHIFFL